MDKASQGGLAGQSVEANTTAAKKKERNGKYSILVGLEEGERVSRTVTNLNSIKTMKGFSIVVTAVFAKHAALVTGGNLD